MELASKVELLELQLEHRQARHSEVSEANAAWAAVDGAALLLERERSRLETANAGLRTKIEETRVTWLARQRVLQTGREIPVLASRSGREFQDVRIARVTEAGIEFEHSTGLARLTAEDLSPEQRREFGIDRERSEALVAAETARSQAYRRWVDRQMVMPAVVAAREETRTTPIYRPSLPEVASGSILDQRRRVSPLHEPARSVGRTRFYTVWNYGDYRSQRNASYLFGRPGGSASSAAGSRPSYSGSTLRFSTPPRSTRPAPPLCPND